MFTISSVGITEAKWKKGWKKGQTNCRSKIETADLSSEIIEPRLMHISGRIINGTLSLATLEKFMVRRGSYSDKRWIYHDDRDWFPEKIFVVNPYGPNALFDVSSSGYFSGNIQLDSKHYFYQYKDQITTPKYHKTYTNHLLEKPLVLHGEGTLPEGVTPSGRTGVNFPLPEVWKYAPQITRVRSFAKNYAENLVCQVSLSFKEQSTRQEVSPLVKVNMVKRVTREDLQDKIEQRFSQEFGGNRSLIKTAMKKVNLNRIFLATQAVNKTKSDIVFPGLVGFAYRIQSIHSDYSFFKGFITPSSSSPISKTVLLVEKGQKISMQKVKEGEGGSMVDSD